MTLRQRLRTLKFQGRAAFIRRFRCYDAARFAQAIVALGVQPHDTLMVHGSFHALSGFDGRPVEMLGALQRAVGDEGLLVMPSMTYTDSSRDFLLRGEAMKQRFSPSRMGLLSETFRRGRNVQRSLSPTHPLLAWGADAVSFVAGHGLTDRPFGDQSPFRHLLERDAKVLCVDAVPETITFTHFLEDGLAPALPFALYDDTVLCGVVVDAKGETRRVPTRVLSDESRRRRDERPLWQRARAEGVLRERRVGNTTLRLLRCRDLQSLVQRHGADGRLMFRLDDSGRP